MANKDRFTLVWELFKQKNYQEDRAAVRGLARIKYKHHETFPLCCLAQDSENSSLPLMESHCFKHKKSFHKHKVTNLLIFSLCNENLKMIVCS